MALPIARDTGAPRDGQAGSESALGEIGRVEVTPASDLGRDEPDVAGLGQVGERVDEPVNHVAVLIAPPQEHDINRFDGVLDEVAIDEIHHLGAELLIAIRVPTQLLNHLTRAEPQTRCPADRRDDRLCRRHMTSARCSGVPASALCLQACQITGVHENSPRKNPGAVTRLERQASPPIEPEEPAVTSSSRYLSAAWAAHSTGTSPRAARAWRARTVTDGPSMCR